MEGLIFGILRYFMMLAPNIVKMEINFTLQADSARRIDQFVTLLKTNTKNSLNVRYSFLIFSVPATDIFRYLVVPNFPMGLLLGDGFEPRILRNFVVTDLISDGATK